LGKASESSIGQFKKLAGQLADGDGSNVAFREGFGTGSLFIGRKMFGVLDESGALVLKLSPVRVQELIAAGVGTPWHLGTGTPLKEYVAIGLDQRAKWLRLAKEARNYMGSKDSKSKA
jgi:hypothetical protein